MHLNGNGADPNELRESGFNTITTFAPTGYSKFLGIRKIPFNVATFNKAYRETGITAAKGGGIFIRKSNYAIRMNNQSNLMNSIILQTSGILTN